MKDLSIQIDNIDEEIYNLNETKDFLINSLRAEENYRNQDCLHNAKDAVEEKLFDLNIKRIELSNLIKGL